VLELVEHRADEQLRVDLEDERVGRDLEVQARKGARPTA